MRPVVADVPWFVCLCMFEASDPYKIAEPEPVEVPFEMWTRVCPRNRALAGDGSRISFGKRHFRQHLSFFGMTISQSILSISDVILKKAAVLRYDTRCCFNVCNAGWFSPPSCGVKLSEMFATVILLKYPLLAI